MATREENIKKINEELEKLDDEQLDKVAGGGFGSFLKGYALNQNPANYQNSPANQVGVMR